MLPTKLLTEENSPSAEAHAFKRCAPLLSVGEGQLIFDARQFEHALHGS